MSILNDLVHSSTSYHGLGMFRFDRISYRSKMLLKSITKSQRKKYKDRELIPYQGLQALWNMGYLPGHEKPDREGIRKEALIHLLSNGQYRDSRNRILAISLRDTIEHEEFPENTVRYEILIKDGRKFVPLFILREEPGTIVR